MKMPRRSKVPQGSCISPALFNFLVSTHLQSDNHICSKNPPSHFSLLKDSNVPLILTSPWTSPCCLMIGDTAYCELLSTITTPSVPMLIPYSTESQLVSTILTPSLIPTIVSKMKLFLLPTNLLSDPFTHMLLRFGSLKKLYTDLWRSSIWLSRSSKLSKTLPSA